MCVCCLGLNSQSINVSRKNCTDDRINCIACVQYLNKVFGTLKAKLCVCYFISIVETISNALFTPFLLVSFQTELLRLIAVRKKKSIKTPNNLHLYCAQGSGPLIKMRPFTLYTRLRRSSQRPNKLAPVNKVVIMFI